MPDSEPSILDLFVQQAVKGPEANNLVKKAMEDKARLVRAAAATKEGAAIEEINKIINPPKKPLV